MDKLDDLTIMDEYGDLTEFKIEFTSYHELPGSDDIYMKILIWINIDS
jgi:hypothetical protein